MLLKPISYSSPGKTQILNLDKHLYLLSKCLYKVLTHLSKTVPSNASSMVHAQVLTRTELSWRCAVAAVCVCVCQCWLTSRFWMKSCPPHTAEMKIKRERWFQLFINYRYFVSQVLCGPAQLDNSQLPWILLRREAG